MQGTRQRKSDWGGGEEQVSKHIPKATVFTSDDIEGVPVLALSKRSGLLQHGECH